MRSRSRRMSTDTSGMAAVEFALVAPIALSMILGAVELGRFAAVSQSLRQGVTEAAQRAMVSSPSSGSPENATSLTAFIRGRVIMAPGADVTVAITYPGSGGNVAGGTVRIAATYSFRPGFGLLPTEPLTINAVTQRRIAS